MVSSIFDLTMSASRAWFRLVPDPETQYEVVLEISTQGRLLRDLPPQCSVKGPLSDDALVKFIRNKARLMTWEDGVEHLREFRRASAQHFRSFHWFGSYRPHIMLIDSSPQETTA